MTETEYVSHPTRVTVDITDGPNWKLQVVIDDETDENAAQANAAWTAEEFDLSDLFGSVGNDAVVTVTLNGDTRQMTGAEFYDLAMDESIGEQAHIEVFFTDREPAEQ